MQRNGGLLKRKKMKRTTVREICQYYGQQYDNVKHMKEFIKQLKKRYKSDKLYFNIRNDEK